MPLLNYTTTVTVDRSVAHVHKMLAKAGAKRVMAEYDAQGGATGIAFTIGTAQGERSFLLPVNAERVQEVLQRQRVERRFQSHEHAQRVAWRIIKDWLEAQLAIIATEMVTLDQVMLPYMASPSGQTMWELYLDSQLALPTGDQP